MEQWLALPNPNLGLIPVAVIVWLKPPSVPSMYRFLAVMPASFLQRPSPAPLISIMFCVIITLRPRLSAGGSSSSLKSCLCVLWNLVRVRVRVKGEGEGLGIG